MLPMVQSKVAFGAVEIGLKVAFGAVARILHDAVLLHKIGLEI